MKLLRPMLALIRFSPMYYNRGPTLLFSINLKICSSALRSLHRSLLRPFPTRSANGSGSPQMTAIGYPQRSEYFAEPRLLWPLSSESDRPRFGSVTSVSNPSESRDLPHFQDFTSDVNCLTPV